MAVSLYLDRLFVSVTAEAIREDLRMSQSQMSWFLSAFFWSYALGQVPAGWFSDRFGARRMLTLYIVAWSALTGLLGVATQVWQLFYLRMFCGIAQAGAYPTAGGLIRVWIPLRNRGIASSIVALGGRAGGVLAPLLTAWLIILFSQSTEPGLQGSDIIDQELFLAAFQGRQQEPAASLVARAHARLPLDLQQRLAASQAKEPSAPAPAAPSFDGRDWIPRPRQAEPVSPLVQELVNQFARLMQDPQLFASVDVAESKLPDEVLRLRRKTNLNQRESELLNRLTLEIAFPKSVKQLRGTGWRPTLMIYGVVGLVVALAVWVIVRDDPRRHPWCNMAEVELIEKDSTGNEKEKELSEPDFPLVPMLTSVSLWGNSLMQVFTNIGWLFAVTWFPRYLGQVHGVSLGGQAVMTAIPTAAGILGMFYGGVWTDLATRRSGRKWGRRLPILATRFTAALGYGICLLLSLSISSDGASSWLPWCYVAALSLMVLSVDMGNPAVWTFAQDVGGKYTGSILGWANMWGNLGAAVAPLIYNAVLGEKPQIEQWNIMFTVCLLAFVLSGLFSLVMDATKSLVRT